VPLAAQNPTGTLSGRVTDDGSGLPGTTVIIDSEALMGQESTITTATGDYLFRFLPPGTYTVTFSMPGFRTLTTEVRIAVAQARQIDAEMYPETVSEEIQVTDSYETIASGTQSAVSYDNELIEALPMDRDLNAAVLLAPGTTDNGPRGGITVAGAQSYENLFLVNGVVVNENIRGQAFDLFIEDAIQETTTSLSGVSAEYGRFAGGVVNMITKSGGNTFSGSYRLSLENDAWIGRTPVTTAQEDELDKLHEATLGGFLVKDHLWFFLAGRDRGTTASQQLYDGTPYTRSSDTMRSELKLTFSPHQRHRIMASYIGIEADFANVDFDTPLEMTALDADRSEPQELLAFNYTGVLSDNLFLEAQYSQRNFTFKGAGGDATPGDVVNGTSLTYPYYGAIAGSYPFCGSCDDEKRDNENALVKASYFLSTKSLGTHDIVFGYDTFSDVLLSNNYQSPSNFDIWMYSDPLYGADGQFYPAFYGNFYADYGWDYIEEIDYWPVLMPSAGTDFTTDSFFVNDTWRLNKNLSFNVGVRWDANDGKDGSGNKVADDSALSPRLGATWDLFGDGRWIVSASYARYVTAIANGVAGEAGGGTASWIGYGYYGPPINVDEEGNQITQYTTTEALQLLFDWFFANGGLSRTDWWYAVDLAGFGTEIDHLGSPYGDEYTVGLVKRLGNKGMIRADYVHREYGDFYVAKKDMETGQVFVEVDIAPGTTVSDYFDLKRVINDDSILRRDYDGLHTQLEYRVNDRLSLGGNWTLSHLRGNWDGEASGPGPYASGVLTYPEYHDNDWARPMGDLATDQRHKVRAWAVLDLLESDHHTLSVSLLQRYNSGLPYGAFATNVRVSPYVSNPGYVTPPNDTTYYFTNRDAYRTDAIVSTDLTLNYSFDLVMGGKNIELYLQPEVRNLFDRDGAWNVNTTVNVSATDDDLLPFNPFTEQPVEGVHWQKGPYFGEPETEDDFQDPRTFKVSLGIRF